MPSYTGYHIIIILLIWINIAEIVYDLSVIALVDLILYVYPYYT